MAIGISMEVRGSMKQFLKLTPEFVEYVESDGLTYEELEQVLSDAGLDIGNVVCDPGRLLQNTYYADYEKGRYCEIYLQRAYMDTLSQVARMSSKEPINRFLKNKDWETYYHLSVPVPMLIYDFQRRYKEIEPEEVFEVWRSIHTRIDYSYDMWPSELLEYVFDHAPKPELPELDEDGKITVYRGMGALSQPTDKAISWSTSNINALWFANRSARGTKLLRARVKPEDVVAYFSGFRYENEVIIRPGAELEIFEEDMIPCTEDYVPKMLLPVMREFLEFSKVALKLGYRRESPFQQHGVKHILRVLLLSLIYFYNSGDNLSTEDKKILIYFSLLHDIGRTSDYVDENHGENGLKLIHKKSLRIKNISMSKKAYRIANLIIANHCREDDIGIAAIKAEPTFSVQDKRRARKLYDIAKDMDGLDRVRFNGLDYLRLRTPYARKLPLVAGGLLEEKLVDLISDPEFSIDEYIAKHDEQERERRNNM